VEVFGTVFELDAAKAKTMYKDNNKILMNFIFRLFC